MAEPNLRDADSRFWDVAVRDGGKCAYCGLDGSGDIRILMSFQLDHLKPRNSGGSDDADNRVLACYVCNTEKKDWDPNEGETEQLSREKLVEKVAEYIKKRRGEHLFYTALYGKLKSKVVLESVGRRSISFQEE
jgi:5-methylcytosine-specific restriction endonuclease McrA